MKTLQTLEAKISETITETSFFVVSIKEDNYYNNGDPKHYETETFSTLAKAFEVYQKIDVSAFQTQSQYRTKELEMYDAFGGSEIVDDEIYNAQYTPADYGKYVLHYLPTMSGASVKKIEFIDAETPFYVNDDNRFSIKSEVYSTRDEVINAIFEYTLYTSRSEAERLFNEILE